MFQFNKFVYFSADPFIFRSLSTIKKPETISTRFRSSLTIIKPKTISTRILSFKSLWNISEAEMEVVAY